jgi:hypothetical protein
MNYKSELQYCLHRHKQEFAKLKKTIIKVLYLKLIFSHKKSLYV